MTAKLSVVFGSLVEVADHHAMVTSGPCCFWGVSGTSLQLVGHREVLSSLLSVSKCCTIVFSGLCKVLVVFSSRRPLIVDLDHRPVADQLPTSPNTTKLCFFVGDRLPAS